MGVDLWFSTRFVSQRPPILKVKVLNFKSIKVTCFDAEKSGFLVHMDPEFWFKIFKRLSWLYFWSLRYKIWVKYAAFQADSKSIKYIFWLISKNSEFLDKIALKLIDLQFFVYAQRSPYPMRSCCRSFLAGKFETGKHHYLRRTNKINAKTSPWTGFFRLVDNKYRYRKWHWTHEKITKQGFKQLRLEHGVSLFSTFGYGFCFALGFKFFRRSMLKKPAVLDIQID